jgi:hypothetical protein
MHKRYSSVNIVEDPWGLRAEHEYEEFCSQREIIVNITSEDERSLLIESLVYRKGNDGSGRTVTVDLPLFGLKKKDFMTPSLHLADVAALDSSPLPIKAVFWRRAFGFNKKQIGPASRRNPLFCNELGITPSLHLAIDMMHTLYLGVFGRFGTCVIHRIILLNPWHLHGTSEERISMACRLLKGRLDTWQTEHGIDPCKKLNDLTPKMIGKLSGYSHSLAKPHPGCLAKTKAYESWILMKFSMSLLETYADEIPYGQELRGAGEALENFVSILQTEPLVVAPDKIQVLFDLMHRALIMFEEAKVHFVPKFHFCIHLAQRSWGAEYRKAKHFDHLPLPFLYVHVSQHVTCVRLTGSSSPTLAPVWRPLLGRGGCLSRAASEKASPPQSLMMKPSGLNTSATRGGTALGAMRH